MHFFHERWKYFDCYDHEMRRSSTNYINWDFREENNLPGKYKLLYCSHVAEHIPVQNLKTFLDIAYRALEPGGAIRFCIPDADLAYQAYAEKRIDFFEIYSSKIDEFVPAGYELEFFLLDFLPPPKEEAGI